MNDYIFKFEFSSCHNHIKNMNYRVFAKTERDLEMFLRQHNFTNISENSIKVLSPSEYRPYEDKFMIKEYLFKSNYSKETYHVMTCEDFVSFAITTTGNSLVDSLLLGEAIIRRDIGIFKLIGDLIYDLPHTNILDFSHADIESTNDPVPESISEIMEMQKMYRTTIGRPTEDAGAAYIHDSFEYESIDTEPQPITLESYVSGFTEMMMDVFE